MIISGDAHHYLHNIAGYDRMGFSQMSLVWALGKRIKTLETPTDCGLTPEELRDDPPSPPRLWRDRRGSHPYQSVVEGALAKGCFG